MDPSQQKTACPTAALSHCRMKPEQCTPFDPCGRLLGWILPAGCPESPGVATALALPPDRRMCGGMMKTIAGLNLLPADPQPVDSSERHTTFSTLG